jgi:transcriptional regulator with XRE-family HTH domain
MNRAAIQTVEAVMPRPRSGVLNTLVRRRLQTLMDQHHLTQADVSRAADERPQDVNRFLTGDMAFPSLDFLDKLARVFQLTLADLLAAELPRPAVNGDELTLLTRYRAMADLGQRQAVMSLLNAPRRKRPPPRKGRQ